MFQVGHVVMLVLAMFITDGAQPFQLDGIDEICVHPFMLNVVTVDIAHDGSEVIAVFPLILNRVMALQAQSFGIDVNAHALISKSVTFCRPHPDGSEVSPEFEYM